MVRISLVLYSANSGQVHKLPKNRPIDSIDLNRLRKNNVTINVQGSPESPAHPARAGLLSYQCRAVKITGFLENLRNFHLFPTIWSTKTYDLSS